jgi:hypothetical protein
MKKKDGLSVAGKAVPLNTRPDPGKEAKALNNPPIGGRITIKTKTLDVIIKNCLS